MKVLMIEDKISLTDAVSEYMNNKKIDFVVKNDGESGYLEALSDTYDVIVLDIMLPNKDGWTILQNLRESEIKTPIIMLSALSEVSDKIKGLNLGADDYLAKPFVMRELEARIRALAKRKDNIITDIKEIGDISLNRDTHELSSKDNSFTLGGKEFEIMELLFDKYPNQVNKDYLAVKVWGYDSDTLYNSVEVYISFLRKKLKALNSKVEIKSIRSLGYKLEYASSK